MTIGAEAVYTTRERIMRSADIKMPAYKSEEVDEFIRAASRQVDRLCHRGDATRPGFAPWQGTITYDWPVSNNDGAYRFWLNQNSLYSLTTAVSGGETITSSCLLRPETGPPYSSIIVTRSSGDLFSLGSGTGENSLAITGVWCGAPVQERSRAVWQLSSGVNDSTTTLPANALIGVGDILRVDSERMIVQERSWSYSGQTGTLASSNSAVTLSVSDGSVYLVGETLLIGSERVLVVDIASNDLTVRRAVDGSVLAAHSFGAIFWSRTFTVERGSLGTTAASHSSGAPVYIYKPPAPIEQLTIAYAIDQNAQENSAYARTVSAGDDARELTSRGLKALEDRVWSAYGRKLRHRAV